MIPAYPWAGAAESWDIQDKKPSAPSPRACGGPVYSRERTSEHTHLQSGDMLHRNPAAVSSHLEEGGSVRTERQAGEWGAQGAGKRLHGYL